MSSSGKIAVIGAGVIGLSVAYRLTEKFGDSVSVTVIADKFTPHTTSDKAGGSVVPYDLTSSKPGDAEAWTGIDARMQRWTKDTFEYLKQLYNSKVAGEAGLCLVTGFYFVQNDDCPDPWWNDVVIGFRTLDPTSSDARFVNPPKMCKKVWTFMTYTVDCRQYLPWLMQQFTERGGSCLF